MNRPTKITFADMRVQGVRGLLIYCADYRCSRSIAISGDLWPDDVRLSDIEPVHLWFPRPAWHHSSVEAALPAQQPLRLHVECMAQRYQVGRVELRAPSLPAHDLCLTVARQCGELAAIYVGLRHRARQALADPLLLGDVVLPEHGRAPFSHLHPTPKRHSAGH